MVPSEPRVETLHRALADADQPSEWDRVREHWKDWPLLVTTTGELDDFGPLGRIWRPVNHERRSLVALADLPPHDETEDPVPHDECPRSAVAQGQPGVLGAAVALDRIGGDAGAHRSVHTDLDR